MNNVINHFSKRASIYNDTKWVNDETILSTILRCAERQSKSFIRILDLGAGTGAVSKYLLKNYNRNKEIIAMDFCEEMLEQLNEPQIKKCIASVDNIPFKDNSFDIIVSRQCLHYIENLEDVISEIKRVLKKDGIFILSQFVPLESDTKDYWKKMMSLRQPLRKVFFSEIDWINKFESNGFIFELIERYTMRYSIKKWNQMYNVKNNNNLEKYIKMIECASEKYLTEYNVSIEEDDIWITSFGVTICFSKA